MTGSSIYRCQACYRQPVLVILGDPCFGQSSPIQVFLSRAAQSGDFAVAGKGSSFAGENAFDRSVETIDVCGRGSGSHACIFPLA